jgi:hypothetical protein
MLAIKETLKYIAEGALAKLREQVGKLIPAKIRWVITVPALWSEEHKYFMRKAAVEAGFIDSVNSSNLLLCLEVIRLSFYESLAFRFSPKKIEN